MKQKKIKFEMKPLVTWDEYENGVKELDPETKQKCIEMENYLYNIGSEEE